MLGAVFRAHVETRPSVNRRRPEGFVVISAFRHPLRDFGVQRGQLLARHRAIDDDKAVAPEIVYPSLGQHPARSPIYDRSFSGT